MLRELTIDATSDDLINPTPQKVHVVFSQLVELLLTHGVRRLGQALSRLGGLEEGAGRALRLFSTWEITRYLIPIATAHFRRVLKANPDLPQGRSETEGGARWFTLDEVLRLRAHFAAEGSKTKEYLPYRPKDLPAKMVAVAASSVLAK